MYWALPRECSHSKGGIIWSTIDRWSDCIGPNRDSRHLGTLSNMTMAPLALPLPETLTIEWQRTWKKSTGRSQTELHLVAGGQQKKTLVFVSNWTWSVIVLFYSSERHGRNTPLHPDCFEKVHHGKVEKILKGSLDSIQSPLPSKKIQIMGRKVCFWCKGKTLLGVVSKKFVDVTQQCFALLPKVNCQ